MEERKIDGKRILYGMNSGMGWTMVQRGVWTAQMPEDTGPWRLEKQPCDPESGWPATGWYLFGPEGVPFGELMFGSEDEDMRLPAAVDAASDYIATRRRPCREER